MKKLAISALAAMALSTTAEARFMPYPDKVEEFCASRGVLAEMYVTNILTGQVTRAKMYEMTPESLRYTLTEVHEMMLAMPNGTIGERAANVGFAIETLCLKNGR